jgi:dGTPase
MPSCPEETAATVEGRIVRFADIIAYVNHDLDDAIRSGVIKPDQTPASCTEILGHTHSQRATTMIRDLIFSSEIRDHELHLRFSAEVEESMFHLRKFLYENVYRSKRVHDEFVKAKKMISELYAYFQEHPVILRKRLAGMEMESSYPADVPVDRIICDFIASITDRYILNLYHEIFIPSPLV